MTSTDKADWPDDDSAREPAETLRRLSPEEAAGVDLDSRTRVVGLITELLDRLWRRER